jgi:polar amino acid transport system substrate-binding protein
VRTRRSERAFHRRRQQSESVRRSSLHVLLAAAALSLATPPSRAQELRPTDEVRSLLAPTGKLRIGLYAGNPSSLLENASGFRTGVGFELGLALSRALDISIEPMLFPNNGAVLDAVRVGRIDLVFTNATAARAKDIDFAQPCVEVEAGYLVPPGSGISGITEIDRSGVRVGVMEGSTSSSTLPALLKSATIVRVPNIDRVLQMLSRRELDVFATNKSILFQLSDSLPGSNVLAGRYGVEQLALGLPKGREAALPFLRAFTRQVISSGFVRSAVDRAGLRGGSVPSAQDF